jgi:hypothetical protein
MAGDPALRISPDVVAQDLGDGLVLLNLRTGIYWGLNSTGAVIWRGIENQHAVEKICRQLGAEFEGPQEELASAVHALLSELTREQLIVENAASAPKTTGKKVRRTK